MANSVDYAFTLSFGKLHRMKDIVIQIEYFEEVLDYFNKKGHKILAVLEFHPNTHVLHCHGLISFDLTKFKVHPMKHFKNYCHKAKCNCQYFDVCNNYHSYYAYILKDIRTTSKAINRNAVLYNDYTGYCGYKDYLLSNDIVIDAVQESVSKESANEKETD